MNGLSPLRAYYHVLSGAILEELAPARTRADGVVHVGGTSPARCGEGAGGDGIYLRDGNDHALSVTERPGLEGKGGMVR